MTFINAPSVIIEVLGSMGRLRDIEIHLTTESAVEEYDSLEILIRNNRLPKLFNLSTYIAWVRFTGRFNLSTPSAQEIV